jgi:membrane protease YdiL (CAAX protease family)
MITNRRLLLPYFLPYFAYVLIASVFGNYLSIETTYLVRIIIVTILIVWAWRWYIPIKGPQNFFYSIAIGISAGFAGVIIWILLLGPFVHPADNQPWTKAAFLLRLISAGLLVPVFEELLMRGYILRFAWQWDQARKKTRQALHTVMDEKSINSVQPGAWSWPAIIFSTIAFTFGHNLQEWPASVVFGLLMAGLWVLRKDLIACIMAHSVTNIALAFYVFKTGNWNFW